MDIFPSFYFLKKDFFFYAYKSVRFDKTFILGKIDASISMVLSHYDNWAWTLVLLSTSCVSSTASLVWHCVKLSVQMTVPFPFIFTQNMNNEDQLKEIHLKVRQCRLPTKWTQYRPCITHWQLLHCMRSSPYFGQISFTPPRGFRRHLRRWNS